MGDLAPDLNEWSRLYQATKSVKDMAPWEWMTETHVFGVQNPETDEIGFVSVMGALGEHLSVAVYLGPKGLYGFWELQFVEPTGTGEELLVIPHLQASFHDRNVLTEQDRDLVKQLGLKFRGRKAWPMFRSYRPGYFPWYLEAPEVRFLTYALEQTLEVAPLVEEDPEFLEPVDDDGYLVRVAQEEGEARVWEDQIISVPPPEPERIAVSMDLEALETVKESSQRLPCLEVDMFIYPAQIGERGARPRYAYMVMAVDGKSGFVLGSKLLMPDPTLNAMYGKVPETVVRLLAKVDVAPKEVHVRSPILFQLMEMLVDDLGFKMVRTQDLPALDRAVDFMNRCMM